MKRMFVVAAAAFSLMAHADTYPTAKPISIVVPFTAGGPTDRVARDLAEAMRKQIPGSNFVVENAAGAGGVGAPRGATDHAGGRRRASARTRAYPSLWQRGLAAAPGGRAGALSGLRTGPAGGGRTRQGTRALCGSAGRHVRVESGAGTKKSAARRVDSSRRCRSDRPVHRRRDVARRS